MQTDPSQESHGVDGGTPTDQEALLASQVDTIGDNPTEEPAAAADDAAGAAADAGADGAPAAGDEPTASGASGDSAAAAAVAEPPAAAAPAEPAQPQPVQNQQAAAPAAAQARPEPPRDFDKAFADLQEQFDNGDIDGAEYQRQQRVLNKEEARYEASVTLYEERQASAQATQAAEWNHASVAWEQQHADFLSNPLRAQAMQQAIGAVHAQNPGLSYADLLAQAGKVAMDAFNYQPQAAAPDQSAAEKIRQATAARAAAPVPATLAAAPAAAPMDPSQAGAYASLDSQDISSVEDAVAKMRPDQLEAYLRDAPGSKTTGV